MSSITNWPSYDGVKPLSVPVAETDRRTIASPIEYKPAYIRHHDSKEQPWIKEKTDRVFTWLTSELSGSDKQLLTLHARINVSLNLPLGHESTIDDLRRMVKGEPTAEQLFNWVANKGLNTKITKHAINVHDWRAHVNKYYKIDQEPIDPNHPEEKKGPHWPVSLELLRNHLEAVTWQEHLNCNRGRVLSHKISLKDLKDYIGKELTPEQVFNWIGNRKLNATITEAHLTVHDWRAHVNKCLGIDEEPIDVNQPAEKKGAHWPVSFEHLKLYLAGATWQDHLNCNRGKAFTHKITLKDFKDYLGKEPTPQQLFNWIADRDLDHEITAEDPPVSFKEFLTFIPKAKWTHHLNYTRMRPIADYEISPSDFQKYLGRAPTCQELMNWFTGDDLDYSYTEEEIDIFPWKQLVNEYFGRPPNHFISFDELALLAPKAITQRELVNCNLGNNLSLGKGIPPKEHFKLVFERLPSGHDLTDLTDYLNRLPTVKEVINWSLNRDLDSDYTEKEYANRFPMQPILLISPN